MRLRLLDFWAPWCGYCTQMEETISSLAAEYSDKIEVQKVNIDEDKDLPSSYRIMAVPTYILINEKGEILNRISGYQTRVAMKSFIDSCL